MTGYEKITAVGVTAPESPVLTTPGMGQGAEHTHQGDGSSTGHIIDKVKDRAGEWASTLKDRAEDLTSTVKDRAADIWEDTRTEARHLASMASRKAEEGREAATHFIRQHPYASLLGLFGIGIVLGQTLRCMMSRD
jgi:ElaB/YqjD/DUF883 family membrane-anchored ribosome-binding protein